MIEFMDFVPPVEKPSMFKPLSGPPLETLMDEVNAWVRRHSHFQIMNIETVALPNIHQKREEGSTDTSLIIPDYHGAAWHQFIRIWYRR